MESYVSAVLSLAVFLTLSFQLNEKAQEFFHIATEVATHMQLLLAVLTTALPPNECSFNFWWTNLVTSIAPQLAVSQ